MFRLVARGPAGAKVFHPQIEARSLKAHRGTAAESQLHDSIMPAQRQQRHQPAPFAQVKTFVFRRLGTLDGDSALGAFIKPFGTVAHRALPAKATDHKGETPLTG